MVPITPLLLGIGMEEVGLILVIYVLLFGVDEIPKLARYLGRAQARLQSYQQSFEEEVERARWGDQAAFERAREQQIRNQDPDYVEAAQVRQAAESLGIPSAGRSVPDLRRAIAARVSSPEDDAGADTVPEGLKVEDDEAGVEPSGDKASDA